MDPKDLEILELLKADGTLPTHVIAKKIGAPTTTVYNRIQRLKKGGVIKKFTIEVDEAKLGRELVAYILLHYNIALWGQSSTRRELKEALLALPHVEDLSYLIGRYDIILKARASNIQELNELILDRFRKIKGIGSSETFIVLENLK